MGRGCTTAGLSAGDPSLLSELASLRAVNQRLREENQRLNKELRWHRSHPTLARGIRGETLVASWVAGLRTSGNAAFDVDAGGCRLEVKLSALGVAVRARASSPELRTLRWTWGKVFGESGRKKYDRLVLIGDADNRHMAQYRDPGSLFVVFEVPFEDVRSVAISSGKIIQLTTNPASARSRASTLFGRYQLSEDELERRYGSAK